MLQLARYLIVGLANTGVGLACIWGAMWFFGLDEISANILGYAAGLTISYALNRGWTFGDDRSVAHSLPRWLAVTAVAYLVNLAIVVFAHRVLGIDAYLAQPLGVAAYTAIGFLGGRYYVFAQADRPLKEAR